MFSDNTLYKEDIAYITDFELNWEKLKNSTILVTGATGLIGTVLVDALMYKNNTNNMNMKIIASSRNEQKLTNRFRKHLSNKLFLPIQADIVSGIKIDEKIDYIVNLASNTHPGLYAHEPIGTIDTIIFGTKNIFELAHTNQAKRVINVSSVEVYGENIGQLESFSENDSGYINCNTVRAGYAEGKRLSEAMGQAYIVEKGLDIISARLGRVYGATLLETDTKSTSQFIKSAVSHENIILKSSGEQRYSYVYVADSVTAILLLLVQGRCGEAYNIADDEIKSLYEVAKMLADANDVNVIKQTAELSEERGFSVVQNALMNCEKIKSLGWSAEYMLEAGLARTVSILKER